MDPAFRLMHFPLDGELDFYLKNWFLFIKKMTWSRHLFLFYFKRVNKIRKKNPKCDSLFWKRVVCEKPDRIRGSGYLLGRYGKDHSTPLSPSSRVSTNKMKQSWQLMRESMNTQGDRAHGGIKTLNKESTEVRTGHTLASIDQCAIKKEG